MAETVATPEIMNNHPKAIIILMRHEESTANANRRYIQGFNPTVPLSDKGEERARTSAGPGLANFLAASKVEIVAAYTSKADRAKNSARIVLTAAGVSVPVTVDERLDEQGRGDKAIGGVEGMERATVETAAYKARQELEGWNFLPGVDDQPGVRESGAETPREAAARWHSWRDDVTILIESGGLPTTIDPDSTPAIFVNAHNLTTSFALGDERGMTVSEGEALYKVDNGEAFILGWDGQTWNLEGQLYRPSA